MHAFCQMVGRDLGQLLGTNLMVCVLCLPAALGGLAGGHPVLPAADGGVQRGHRSADRPLPWCCWQTVPCAACRTTPLSGCPGQKQTLAAHWKAACGFGCIGTLVLGLLCFVSAFVFEAAAQQGVLPRACHSRFSGTGLSGAGSSGHPVRRRAAAAVPRPGQPAAPGRQAAGRCTGALRMGRRSHAGGHRRDDLAVPGQHLLGGAVRFLAAGAGGDADPVPGFAAGIRRRGAQHPAPDSAG